MAAKDQIIKDQIIKEIEDAVDMSWPQIRNQFGPLANAVKRIYDRRGGRDILVQTILNDPDLAGIIAAGEQAIIDNQIIIRITQMVQDKLPMIISLLV